MPYLVAESGQFGRAVLVLVGHPSLHEAVRDEHQRLEVVPFGIALQVFLVKIQVVRQDVEALERRLDGGPCLGEGGSRLHVLLLDTGQVTDLLGEWMRWLDVGVKAHLAVAVKQQDTHNGGIVSQARGIYFQEKQVGKGQDSLRPLHLVVFGQAR